MEYLQPDGLIPAGWVCDAPYDVAQALIQGGTARLSDRNSPEELEAFAAATRPAAPVSKAETKAKDK